jgi:hypothetical protein
MRSNRPRAPHAPAPERATSAPRRATRAGLLLLLGLVLASAAAPAGATAATRTGRALIDDWRTTHGVSVVHENETGPRWSGTWRRVGHGSYLGDAARNSRASGASTTLTFRGSGIAWVGALGPNRGRARVVVDGEVVRTVDTGAGSFKGGRVLFSRQWSSVGDHTIRIVNRGTSGRPNIALDAFVVRGAALPKAPSGMPTTDLPGWNLVFTDDFTTNVASGEFPSKVSSRWWAYGPGWSDTSGRGVYTPSIITQHDGLLDVHLHTSGGKHRVAAMVPKLPGGGSDQTYGRYAVRFRADAVRGYKAAWMLWPRSDVWPGEGEVDFPEGDFNETIWAFMHRRGATSGSDQDYYRTDEPFDRWHTAVIEWSPDRIRFILDGRTIGTSTSRLPNTPFHWVLQNETSLDTAPSDSASGHVLIDWVAIWAYDP